MVSGNLGAAITDLHLLEGDKKSSHFLLNGDQTQAGKVQLFSQSFVASVSNLKKRLLTLTQRIAYIREKEGGSPHPRWVLRFLFWHVNVALSHLGALRIHGAGQHVVGQQVFPCSISSSLFGL